MAHIISKTIPKLRRAAQPPLSHAGAIRDSDRARRPPLASTLATDQELNPGDRVEGLGNFGKPTGESFGIYCLRSEVFSSSPGMLADLN